MKGLDMTPIACSLTTVELRDRAAALLAQFRSALIQTEELPEGYAFLQGNKEHLQSCQRRAELNANRNPWNQA
jgi:hypothetical protein